MGSGTGFAAVDAPKGSTVALALPRLHKLDAVLFLPAMMGSHHGPGSRHVRELDGVRGIACLLVVTWHCLQALLIATFCPFLPQLSHLSTLMIGGVDLFFVLSGFLIGGILLDSRKASNFFTGFWTRRVCRIFPVYVLLLATYAGALSFQGWIQVPWVDQWLLQSPLPFWTYATFTQNYLMAARADTGAFWVGITWSLAVEEQFYLIFPFLIFALRRRTLILLAIISVFTAAYLRIWLWRVGGAFYSGYFPTPARIDALMLGFLATCIVRSDVALWFSKRLRLILDLLALIGLAAIIDGRIVQSAATLEFSILSSVFAYAILRIFLVDSGIYRAILRTPLLVRAGAISYAWYMYHQAVNGLVHGLLFGHPPVISNVKELGAAFSVLMISGVLAALSTRYFERPFREFGRRLYSRSDETIPILPSSVPG